MLVLDLAAVLLVGIGFAHSLLGERFVLKRIERLESLPTLRLFGRESMADVLRFAWHITTVAWFGFAALLVLAAHDRLDDRSVLLATAATFFATGLITLWGGRGRHLSWIVFFAVAALVLFEAGR
ncbi:hypothetical protein [Halomonas denitrificans]|nr:hypothetical protein [Halomonas denitrificans]